MATALLRTPTTLHPSPMPSDLGRFAERRNKTAEIRSPRSHPDVPAAPTAALLREFCLSHVVKKLPKNLRTVRRDTVVDIQPLSEPGISPPPTPTPSTTATTQEPSYEERRSGTGGGHAVESSPLPVHINVRLASGAVIPASAVIVATGCSQPIIPSWARHALSPSSSPLANDAAQQKKRFPAIATWNDVDTSSATHRDVVIVGGGTTAALLALEAVSKGASEVTLLSRRPLLSQPFDCAVGWWGNKHLNAFWQERDPEQRMRLCRKARMQGSISPDVWDDLVEAAANGSIRVLQGVEIAEAMVVMDDDDSKKDGIGRWKAVLQRTEGLQSLGKCEKNAFEQAMATALVAAKGTESHQKAGHNPPDEIKDEYSLSNLSIASPSSSSSSSSPATATATTQQQQPASHQTLRPHLIWLACGASHNAATHPLFAALQPRCPTRIVGGYPVLDQETCLWPGAPVYVVGKDALLAMGPCAGGMAGMRLAADRIAKSLKKLRYAGNATEWDAAKERTADMVASSTSVSRNAGVALAGKQGGANGSSDWYLQLEEDGQMWIEPKPKRSVTRPMRMVDVSDLEKTLPRHEIQRFSFSDDDFEICVTLQLPERVEEAHVRSVITETSLDVWCIGAQGAYRLHVPKLYGKVLPSRCRVRAKPEKNKVFIILFKEKDAEWRFLKS
jgi:hypothetical protein